MKNLVSVLFIFFLVNLQGQISFYETFSGSSFDEGQGITQLADSSYLVTGSSGSFSSNSGQAYLMLVDSLGEHVWTKSYGGDGSDWGRRVFHKPGIGFTIAGYTNSTNSGDFDFYIVQTDELGNLKSEKNIGTENWERLWDAKMLNDQGLIMVGESEGETTDLKDMYVVRTNDEGDTIWTKTISTEYDDVAYAVDMIDDTTFVIGGDSWLNNNPRSTIISMHINGNVNWQVFHGDTVETGIRDLQVFNNNIYAGGYIVPIHKTDRDFWILKTDMNGVFVKDFVKEWNGDDFLSSITVKNTSSLYISIISNSSDLGVYSEGTDAFIQKFHTNLYYNFYSMGFAGQNSDIVHQMITTVDDGIAFSGTCGDDRVIPSSGTDIMIAKLGPNDETTLIANNDNDLVSLTDNEVNEIFRVYPNPTAQKLNIPESLLGKEFTVFNCIGKEINTGFLESVIDVSNYEYGVYQLNILYDSNVLTIRFVKI